MTDLFSIRCEWNEERATAQELLKQQEACALRKKLIEQKVREALREGTINPIDFVAWGTDGLVMLREALWNKLSLKECGRRWREIKKLAGKVPHD